MNPLSTRKAIIKLYKILALSMNSHEPCLNWSQFPV